MSEPERVKLEMLRHTIATLAYRGGKAIKDAPADFASFEPGPTTRTPIAILAHIGDLLDWALGMARGDFKWQDSPAGGWDEESSRFFDGLKKFDDFLASGHTIAVPLEKLFQGPIADALTHVGQITLLRRMAEAPVRGENYFKAEIEAGRVGTDQSANRVEFD